jgi:hypothetical protein
MEMPERFKRLLVMNATIAVGASPSAGFDNWKAYVKANPDFDVARLMRRTTPVLSEAEAEAYSAPFPDAAGKLLYPGVQTGFVHLREAVAGLKQSDTARVLVVSSPRASLRNGSRRGFTASPMRIPRSTRAFRRRSTTRISQPTACTSRSATWRNIRRRIPRSTWKNSSRSRSCRCAVEASSNATGH